MEEPPQLELSNLEIQNSGPDITDGKTGEFYFLAYSWQQSAQLLEHCCKANGLISVSPEPSCLLPSVNRF